MKVKRTISQAQVGYAEANRMAAALILSDPAKYEDSEGLMVRWARLILATDRKQQEQAA